MSFDFHVFSSVLLFVDTECNDLEVTPISNSPVPNFTNSHLVTLLPTKAQVLANEMQSRVGHDLTILNPSKKMWLLEDEFANPDEGMTHPTLPLITLV